MIITNSAGNEGNSPWKYLSVPADGDSILAVGAVNVLGEPAGFSSYGPAADGRVKPDIASVGWNTFFVTTQGTISQGNGTSFSNPNVAGLITCLWQAFPEFSNMEIIDAAVWGGNGNQLNAGNGGDPLNHNGTALAPPESIRPGRG